MRYILFVLSIFISVSSYSEPTLLSNVESIEAAKTRIDFLFDSHLKYYNELCLEKKDWDTNRKSRNLRLNLYDYFTCGEKCIKLSNTDQKKVSDYAISKLKSSVMSNFQQTGYLANNSDEFSGFLINPFLIIIIIVIVLALVKILRKKRCSNCGRWLALKLENTELTRTYSTTKSESYKEETGEFEVVIKNNQTILKPLKRTRSRIVPATIQVFNIIHKCKYCEKKFTSREEKYV